MPVCELQGKNITYNVLKNLSFELRQGEVLALMGQNGSGKSTLARLIAGLINPLHGEINLWQDGVSVYWSEVNRWQQIGFIGQHPRRQTIGATVAEELGFGLLNLGYEVKQVRGIVRELAGRIGLEKQLNQSPSTLSGGERQRLVIAAVLAINPTFLLLDEALTMLDERSQERCLELIRERQTEMGQLWITHDPVLASQADRLVILQNGMLLDLGEPKQVLADSKRCDQLLIRSLSSDNRRIFAMKAVYEGKPSRKVMEWVQASYTSRLQIDQVIESGEFIGILGPSGAGKSTLLESAIALLEPTEGTFRAFDQEVTKHQANQLRQRVRLVLQEPGEYQIGRNVYEEVFYLQSRKERKQKQKDNISYLESFGIPQESAFEVQENLSGGERQKVALAAALESLPEVLLLDEPLLGLDAPSRKLLQGMIGRLKGKLVILYVTHDLAEVTDLADRLWLIEEGKVKLDCSGQDWVRCRERFLEAGVRCPNY